ncbi:glycine cleavage system protein GcvH [candidate division KSB1 bacterium]|nr:glycine cleavage system protein GcvH [candidate division KSB1 bacterium]
MKVPEELFYTEEHEWISVDENIATIGITDYAQGELGDVVFVELPKPGTQVMQMEPFGTIEAVKAVSDLFAPVSGEIIEINEVLDHNPETVNQEPYGAGWMIKIKMSDPNELNSLLKADAYKDKIA